MQIDSVSKIKAIKAAFLLEILCAFKIRINKYLIFFLLPTHNIDDFYCLLCSITHNE